VSGPHACIQVHGRASAEEIAAVIATLGRAAEQNGEALSGYERWRLGRIKVSRPRPADPPLRP
jgi:hypothetical protein